MRLIAHGDVSLPSAWQRGSATASNERHKELVTDLLEECGASSTRTNCFECERNVNSSRTSSAIWCTFAASCSPRREALIQNSRFDGLQRTSARTVSSPLVHKFESNSTFLKFFNKAEAHAKLWRRALIKAFTCQKNAARDRRRRSCFTFSRTSPHVLKLDAVRTRRRAAANCGLTGGAVERVPRLELRMFETRYIRDSRMLKARRPWHCVSNMQVLSFFES